MNNNPKRFHHQGWPFILLAVILMALPFSTMAADDDTPFFAGRTGSPNVMILFDNSNSMQNSPYFMADGENIYKPSTYWRRGVVVNPDCSGDGDATDDPCIAEDGDGDIIYDQSKWVSTDDELILPGQNPPNLPGLSVTSSTVTLFQSGSSCPSPNESLTCSNRIYDSSVDWSLLSTWASMAYNYRHWKVKITDQNTNTSQYRSFYSRSESSGYWTVYGDLIEYDTTHSYQYEIVAGSPGEITSEQTDNNMVYDRNFDWSMVSDWSNFDSNYRYKILEVTAGTNVDEQRAITGRNTSYGYWTVDADFPVPCDYTTKYRILGVVDDNKYATGGNHPDSKMYQAKLALKKFLESSSIKTIDTDIHGVDTERYLMNLGFSTFLQARVPITRAKYYRKRGVEHPAEFSYMYRANNSHSTTAYNPTGCVDEVAPSSATFTVTYPWTQTYTDISDGEPVDRLYQSGQCSEQTIRYKVTYSCAPTDSLPDRVKINLESNNTWTDPNLAGVDPEGNDQWGYTWIGWRYFADDGSGDCTGWDPPDPSGNRDLVNPGETCYEDCRNHPAWTENPYYQITWKDTYGDLRKTAPATPGYINKNPAPSDNYIVTPYKGYCSGSWNCTNPDPEDISDDGYGDYALVTPAAALTLVDVAIHNNGTIGTITSEIFDYSQYRYPGKTDDIDHPHGWSYKTTERDPSWLSSSRYKKDDDTYLTDDHFIYAYSSSSPSIWPDTDQPDPYFPATTGDEFSNYDGDDQVVFVNLPEYNDADADKGDDFSGANITKVLNYINLARVEYPRNRCYVHTMAPISKGSLTVNSHSDQTGAGTPLAATLADARKYLTSYMEQDNFSQGGCRKNYIILLTDGLESAGGDPVVEAAALQTLIVNGEMRPVKLYVIGFGLDQDSQATLNAIAAAGGSDTAYFANNVEQLVTILAHDITSDILGGSYGRGKVALTRGGMDSSSGLTLYSAYFDYPVWRGHVEAWSLYPDDVYDGSGNLLHRAGEVKIDGSGNKTGEPHWCDGCSGSFYPPSNFSDPDAGCIMAEDNATPGSPPDGPIVRRTLYTTKADDSRVVFDPANAAALQVLLNPTLDDINNDGLSGDLLDAKTIINFIHHPGFDDADYFGTRDKNWPLADIYHSGPALVTASPEANCLDADNNGVLDSGSWPGMDGYCNYAEGNKNRAGMLYFGTNGGMIQAITTGKPGVAMSGGREEWGYIPKFVLPKLKEIKEGHRFTMDLTILASEVDTSDGLAGTGWKTMLLAGQRKGGNGYIALDVTDPTDPLPMWEFVDTHKIDEADAGEVRDNLGQTWSRPSIARIMINGTKTSVVIFGGGYSPFADKGNRLYIVKAGDGTILHEIVVGSSSNNVPSRIIAMPYLTNNVGTVVDYRTNMAQLPDGTVVDYSDRGNSIEVAYFGDTSGNVWRLDGLNTTVSGVWNPAITKLYQPGTNHDRPIYYPPVVTDIKKGFINNGVVTGCVKRYLLLGTGNEHDPTGTRKADLSPMIDYFFEIEDSGNAGVTDESNLNWRFSLGMQLPSENGFLLKPDGTRAKKSSLDILSKYIFLIDAAEYTAQGWSIDVNGHLKTPAPAVVLAALNGEYLFKNAAGDLYSDVSLTNSVASAGTYTQVDFGLWLTDENGWFYDSEDGISILDASGYSYDNDGYWIDGSGTRRTVNGNEVIIVVDPGEKILAAPVGYGEYIYFTTYTPVGGCAAGTSYFYGLKTSTCGLNGGTGLLNYDMAGNQFYSAPRRRIALGTGITAGVTLGGGMAYMPLYSPGNDPNLIATPVPVGITQLKYWKQN